ncbi:MAG: YqeG family HAD IIIA-type phosphatase [Acholeplasma sp.]|nr:YqeG family HAD IIIA-type phosphatase [Acholeplasma sp.]
MVKKRYVNFIPNEHQKSVNHIDFLGLYDKGFRVCLIDIDNTLVSYQQHEPTDLTISLLEKIESIGFKLLLISNNNQKRVSEFSKNLHYPYISSARKPLKKGFKKALTMLNEKDVKKVLNIGDQIMTDVLGGNRMGFYTIYVDPIMKKSDILPTRINRKMEAFFLNKARKHHKALFEKRFKYEKM